MASAFTYELPRLPDARGGQGAVYFGTRSDGAAIAVKVASGGQRAKEALEREIGVLREMKSIGVPGVVPCLDVIELDDQPALVMPRFQGHLGQWLQRVIQEPDAGSLTDVLGRCASLARTLDGVHRVDFEGHRIVHRDVKPENIFVDEHGGMYLGDFGGAMAIDGLRHVELALFGTPMWAPLDQILPGVTIPDPTWDSYALCVLLYAALTGARPAYQADPRELLTEKGRAMWQLAREAIHASGPPRKTLRKDFARQRVGTRAEDLVDFTGRGALNEGDRAAIEAGVERLAALAGLPLERKKLLVRGLWALLARGLSPLSHPSPPNRYRDCGELAETLEDLRQIAQVTEGTPAPTPRVEDLLAGPMPGPDLPVEPWTTTDMPASTLTASAVPVWLLGGAGLLVTLVAAWVAIIGWPGHSAMVSIPAGTAPVAGKNVPIPAFLLDRTEVTATAYARCVGAGACKTPAASSARADLPAVGVPFEDAGAYCRFRGGRLPSLGEWVHAAGATRWPWGDADPTCAHAVALGCGDDVQPVGSAPEGSTSSGVADLAGNAWEWVVDEDGTGLLIGGSVRSPASQIGRFGRMRPTQGADALLAGVRCAYDPR